MFRDEAPYIDEWLRFHLDRGVEHFFLYDHGSSDGGEAVLAPYVARGLVTLHRWPVQEKIEDQVAAYNHTLAHYGTLSRWIAFIDLDEFLFSPQGSLPDKLRGYEDYAGVFAFWRCYGSSGFRDQQPGRVTETYLRRAHEGWARNRRGKSIVDPRRVERAVGPHHFIVKPGGELVNEARQAVRFGPVGRWTRQALLRLGRIWPRLPADIYAAWTINGIAASAEVFRINHYVVKSLAEYVQKMDKNNLTKRHKKRYTPLYFRYHDRNEVLDPVLKGSVRPSD